MVRKLKGSLQLNPGATPGSPVEGEMYYDSTDKNLYIYSNGSWNIIGESDQLVRYEQAFTAETTVNVTHNLGNIPAVFIYDSSGEIIYPDTIENTDANNLTVTFAVSQTGTIVCLAGVDLTGPTAHTTQYEVQFTSQIQVVVNHNLGFKPLVQVRNLAGELVLPTKITHNSVNQCTVDFDSSQSGYVTCLVGGMNNVTAVGNADMVDGFNASQTPGADEIPVLDGTGKLPAIDGSKLTNIHKGVIVWDAPLLPGPNPIVCPAGTQRVVVWGHYIGPDVNGVISMDANGNTYNTNESNGLGLVIPILASPITLNYGTDGLASFSMWRAEFTVSADGRTLMSGRCGRFDGIQHLLYQYAAVSIETTSIDIPIITLIPSDPGAMARVVAYTE